ncbi:hypothetical protein NS220_10970, partial [Microbacterium testaceum]
MASTPRTPRRGLPRVPGGEPWPPVAAGAPAAGSDASPESGVPEAADARPADASTSQNVADLAESASDSSGSARLSESERTPPADSDAADPPRVTAVRRGLPRVPGGEPWPSAADRRH